MCIPMAAHKVDNGFIPFKTKGTKISFKTRVPTDNELATSPHIELTSPMPWEPTEVTMQEMNRKRRRLHKDQPYKRVIQGVQLANCLSGNHEYTDPSSDEAILSQVHAGQNKC